MRKIVRRLLSSLLGVGLLASGSTVASAAPTSAESPLAMTQTGKPDLPFDPHEYGDDQWLGMPPHARCDESGKGSSELIISMDEDWTGGTEIEINATEFNADSATDSTVIWNSTVSVQPGTWSTVTIPVDDRGVRIWVSEEGLSYQGSLSTLCQTAPIRPTQAGNTIAIPQVDDLQYFVAPVSVDGQPVEARWDPVNFIGFYVGDDRLETVSEPVTGEVAVPEVGLQVVTTGLYGVMVEFDWDEAITSAWNFSYDSDPTIPQTPPEPTQDGNSLMIPVSEAFTYVSGNGETLASGVYTLTADLVVTVEPKDGFTAAKGSTTTWAFTFTLEPTRTPPPTSPPESAGPTAADLTAKTRGHTQTPTEAVAGDRILITVGDKHAGQSVRVIMYSMPRDLGTFVVAANGTIIVTLPSDVAGGDHRLAVYDGDNGVIGWDPITITLPNIPPNNPGALGDPRLAAGVSIPFSTIVMAVLLLAAGAAAMVLQRRRDEEPSEEDSEPGVH